MGAGDVSLRARMRVVFKLAGIELSHESESSADAVAAMAVVKARVCLLSTCLDGHAFLAVARIGSRNPRVPILLLDASPSIERMRSALRAGASGYLPTDGEDTRIARAIDVVRSGQLALPRDMVGGLVEELLRPGRLTASTLLSGGPNSLTRRERELLQMLASGMSSEWIAQQLYVSPATVRSHVMRIARKLGLKGRNEVVAYAKQMARLR